MPKALITTVPFADKNRLPLELLEAAGIELPYQSAGAPAERDGIGRNGRRMPTC